MANAPTEPNVTNVVQFESRPKDTDRKTRIHLSLFDRLKFLVAFTLTFFVLVWSDMA